MAGKVWPLHARWAQRMIDSMNWIWLAAIALNCITIAFAFLTIRLTRQARRRTREAQKQIAGSIAALRSATGNGTPLHQEGREPSDDRYIWELREVAERAQTRNDGYGWALEPGVHEAAPSVISTNPDLDQEDCRDLQRIATDMDLNDATFIATFDPPTVLDLLDRLAAAEARDVTEALDRQRPTTTDTSPSDGAREDGRHG